VLQSNLNHYPFFFFNFHENASHESKNSFWESHIETVFELALSLYTVIVCFIIVDGFFFSFYFYFCRFIRNSRMLR
jgi:hypothetical protein